MVAGLAAAKLMIHLLTNGQYGYFRDELYYLACGEHLDWGYVDQPPLIAVAATTSRRLLGDSLHAIRFLPALSGALKVVVGCLLVHEFGGRRYAQVLAGVAIIVAPIYLGTDNILTMNTFEPLFWMLCAYLVVRMLKTNSTELWPAFGVAAGIGLLNKYSMLFMVFGLLVGLALTPGRRLLLSWRLLLGVAIAVAEVFPNLVWQVEHGWATLQMLHNVAVSNKNAVVGPLGVVAQQALLMHPLALPIWLAGLWWLLISRDGRRFRALGWAYLVMLVAFILLKGKSYYLAPAYPMLIAAGAVAAEAGLAKRPGLGWLRPASVGALSLGGIVTAPLALPVLSPPTYVRYSRALHLEPPKTENHQMGPLPQYYADMFGWDEMVATVASVYRRLPAAEQSQCAIFAQNYGEAGAIDFFGPRYGLPKAISGHQSYFLWGPRAYTGDVMIVIGDSAESLARWFHHVKLAAVVRSRYAMPYESNLPVFVCRGLRGRLQDLWPRVKSWR